MVSSAEIRERYNALKVTERIESGELVKLQEKRRPASRPGMPPGMVSVVYHVYTRTGQKVAVVHCYEHSDGTIGGSGKLDPKMLRDGDDALRARAE